MIPDEPTFLARLHAALDARRDPFADDELVAWLDAHPSWLDRTARLCADVRTLAASSPPATRRRRRRALPAAATLAAAALAVFVPLATGGPAAPAGRLLAAELSVQPPRAHLAVRVAAREVLIADGGTQLTSERTRSLRR